MLLDAWVFSAPPGSGGAGSLSPTLPASTPAGPQQSPEACLSCCLSPMLLHSHPQEGGSFSGLWVLLGPPSHCSPTVTLPGYP